MSTLHEVWRVVLCIRMRINVNLSGIESILEILEGRQKCQRQNAMQ